ncbi:helix-turn-helix domain-containing protein [Nonomuraea sp. SYSU D8015]|uniref:helix-turn-helix domain-containing protein n=1 Tax=Nonomuraea sp. SYSU D8015 TaxID=2593644 RepID=UPI00166049E2|nr:helix-turn-helix domain-containing protein [Nonomuraea sp. SYSU D8015]
MEFLDLSRAGLSRSQIAEQLHVSERTILRYEHHVNGGSRRPTTYYERMMPLILAHLRRYPKSRFTTGELERVLVRDRPVYLDSAMRRMEQAGLVTRTVEPRNDGLFAPTQSVVWWQLNTGGAPRFLVCTACNLRPVRVQERGWCRACNERWYRAGKPADGPPQPKKGGRPRQPATEEKVQQTRELLAEGKGTMQIARLLGVGGSTVTYYKQRLAERDELPQAC